MKKVKRLLASCLNATDFTSRILHSRSLHSHVDSFLVTAGWFESARLKMPIDANGNPIPWITYSALAFLEPRVEPDFRVFEYGSGNSTLWWSGHVRKVVSCEHDQQWYDLMKANLPQNVSYHHRPLADQEYPSAINETEHPFDVVVIDGRERNECAKHTLGKLSGSGVVIWDNSERDRYQESFELLSENGFRRIDFWGMGPIATSPWMTSIFYRQENCLNI